MKKANAMMEYSVLIFIVIAAIAGLNFALKRHFQAFIKSEADEHIRQPSPFLWQSSVKFSTQTASQDRYEFVGGDTVVNSNLETPYTVLSAPPPPYMPGVAGLSAQDAALPHGGQKQQGHKRTKDKHKTQNED
ncbi:MAG: hypothetical protein WC546_05060 [Candidatus Omnitrophota bacterium]